MRKILIRSAAVAVLSLAALGCKSGMMSEKEMNDKGMMTVATPMMDKDVMMDAPMDGDYMLVVPGPMSRPMYTVSLKKGDKIGFMNMPGGTMMAMAGDRTYDVTGKKGVMWVHGMAK